MRKFFSLLLLTFAIISCDSTTTEPNTNINAPISSDCLEQLVLPQILDSDTTIQAESIIVDSTTITANVILQVETNVTVDDYLIVESGSLIIQQINCE